MKSKLMMTICLSSFSLVFIQLAQAQYCGVSNASLTGSYGFVASEAGASTTGTTTGTTTTGANPYSNTNIGQLLGGIAAGNQFAFSGVLTFDGAGNITSSAAPTGTAVALIGTYNVNSDCSVSVSLTDAFGTTTTPTQLVGVILGRGAEIDLTSQTSLQSQSGTTSASTTTPGSGSSTTTGTQSGLAIKLVRVLYQNGCSDSTLTGLYGFVLNPTAMQTPTTSTTGGTSTTSSMSALIGYLVFNGSGQIVALPTNSISTTSTSSTTSSTSGSTSSTTYSALAFTGTYSVNPDCSGTMSISNPSSSTSSTTSGTSTTTTGSTGTLTIGFVITPPASSFGSVPATPGLSFGFSNAEQSGTGYALAQ